MPTVELLRKLKGAQEVQNAFGIGQNDSLVTIYRTKDRTSWSIVEHFPSGVSCMVAAGVDWQFINPFNFRVLPQLDEKKTQLEKTDGH